MLSRPGAIQGAARAANIVIGAAYLLLGVVGLFMLASEADILALNSWTTGPHLASAALLLGLGVSADKRTAVRSS